MRKALNALLSFLYDKLYNKLHIILEIIGAVYLLISTLFTRIRMMSLTTDSDNIENAVNSLLTEVKGQFTTQLICFGLFVAGLIIQIFKIIKNKKSL